MTRFRAVVVVLPLIFTSPLAIAGTADVIAATARQTADGTWSFEVTMRCDDRNAAYFCDRFEILTPTSRVIGVRRLLHDHTDEQPFTRDLQGVKVPDGFPRDVLIRGHHNIRGYEGATLKLDLPARAGNCQMMAYGRKAALAVLDEQVSADLMDVALYIDTSRQLKHEFEY